MAKSTTELQEMREQMAGQMSLRVEDKNAIRVVVGMGTCGIAAGARDIMRVIVDEVGAHNATHVKVIMDGKNKDAENAPVVEIHVLGKDTVTYTKVDAAKAKQIAAEVIGEAK